MERMRCKKTLIEWGFTPKLIEQLLPKPTLKTNSYNLSRPMKMWKESEVLEAMETDIFKQAQVLLEAEHRKKQESFEVRKNKCLEQTREALKDVKVYRDNDLEKLRIRAIDSNKQRILQRNNVECWVPPNEETAIKWIIKFIEKKYVTYSGTVPKVRSNLLQCYINDERDRIINEKILEVYPEYKGITF